jgi:hypothetical protein
MHIDIRSTLLYSTLFYSSNVGNKTGMNITKWSVGDLPPIEFDGNIRQTGLSFER